ncbi:MAG: DUF370 domain-containing protein [Armatimonadetes bacterium]|nr:MAG: DUF370 domain-containing protein [Armatimonadota bacterium]
MKEFPVLPVGFKNYVLADHVIAIIASDSSPVRRLIQLMKDTEKLVDASQGKKVRSVIFMDSGHVVLSALSREVLVKRIAPTEPLKEDTP